MEQYKYYLNINYPSTYGFLVATILALDDLKNDDIIFIKKTFYNIVIDKNHILYKDVESTIDFKFKNELQSFVFEGQKILNCITIEQQRIMFEILLMHIKEHLNISDESFNYFINCDQNISNYVKNYKRRFLDI